MNSRPIIRSPEQKDAASILELVIGINTLHNDPTDLFNAEAVQRDVFGADSPVTTLVAELDGEVVGFVFYHNAYESGYAERGLFITDIFVAEKARRHGIARALVKAVAGEADKKGYTYLWWNSQPWNTSAHEFYRDIGAIEHPVIAHALIHEQFKKILEDE